ncbi:exosome component 10 [Drosophila grimshawi]|uniref:Exosome complex component 10 homolog n=1 Tax=Drosophila grimshawi TaxID=7222 RepID=B4JF39_DROGR|nr:exosome component 10 [Drosophila grimshawi]EDV93320.1 GH19240 [Drosophila grimshawi]
MPQPPKRSKETDSDPTTESKDDPDDRPSTSQSSTTSLIDFTTAAFRNVVAATRSCNAFPQGNARDVYLSYPGYARMLEEQSQRVLGLINKVLQAEKVAGDIRRRQGEEKLELVQECNDILFERITTNLDIKSGQRRGNQQMVVETQVDVQSASKATPTATTITNESATPRAGSWNRISSSTMGTPSRSMVSARLFTAPNIMRPQMRFKVPVDNSATNPFQPRLTEKPNSLKPLALLPEYDEADNIVSFLHPYEFELLKFEPAKEQLQKQNPQMPAPPEKTELMLVDSVEKLQQALAELRLAHQIAIDVEHHSYRTFMGITCLVQMSTRTKDYIFDTLILRDDMHILNLVLTDPKVLKILHGGDLDIEWLQRDLSLYIVNMFDTHRAAKALNLARLSLAFLLKFYLDMDVDKSLQLADWRMRPLPQKLIDYARQDTHYLIYIYERLVNDLLQSEQGQSHSLRMVYQQSTDICKKRYTKPYIGPDSHLDLVRKTKRSFDNRQLYALRGIFTWRDATARQEDESYGYVLPNHMMLQIAESLPREMQGILACCNPIPPLVRQQLHTLHQIVLRAREQSLIKPILEASCGPQGSVKLAPITKDFSSKLNCPHDFSHQEETRDDLPTLLGRSTATGKLQRPDQPRLEATLVSLKAPALSLFRKSAKPTQEEKLRWMHARKESQTMRMPYKRYLAILPLMQQEKIEQAARENSELLKRRLCPAEPAPESLKLELEPKEEPPQEDATYNLPLKEQLKRKHLPATPSETSSQAKRNRNEDDATPSSSKSKKRSIEETHNEDDSADDSVVEVPIERSASENPVPALSKRQQKRQQQNQRFKAKSRMPAQSSNRAVQLPATSAAPQNFDYQNVDFRQFQGGAKRAHGTEIKAQIHGKNRPNNRNNKKFNKLFTFSKVKSGRK